MSATDSSVVYAPRAGPIWSAHRSSRRPSEPVAGAASAGQVSGSEEPVPRWSKRIRSRAASAGDIVLAMNSASGSVAWPGPPTRASTALAAGTVSAPRRSTRSVIVPPTRPPRSSGTARVAQSKPGLAAHGANVRAAAEGGQAATAAATRSGATSAAVRARLDIGHTLVPAPRGRRRSAAVPVRRARARTSLNRSTSRGSPRHPRRGADRRRVSRSPPGRPRRPASPRGRRGSRPVARSPRCPRPA